MGVILFLLGPSKHLGPTQDIQPMLFSMLGQRCRRCPIIEKLTTPTIYIVFAGYIASGSGYEGRGSPIKF